MRTSVLLLPMVSVLLATPALAQRSADEWVAQCRRLNDRPNNPVTHCEVRETRIPPRGSLTIDAGEHDAVTVRRHEGRDVVVQARVQSWGGSDERARATARQIRVNTGGTISASGPDWGNGSGWIVNYEILVPARTNLDVRTHNGSLNVERVSGTMNLRASNGPLNLSELSGNVTARTQNGPVNVRLSGRRWTGERLDVETVNGPVSVRMPEGYAAHLEARTVHGPALVPRAIRPADQRRPGERGWRPGANINTDINGGGPTIRAVTTNGPLSIQEG